MMKKKSTTIIIVVAAVAMLTACGNISTERSASTTKREIGSTAVSEETTIASNAKTTMPDQSNRTKINDVRIPQKEEVTAMRAVVLDGMSENDINDLCSIIKDVDHAIESGALYNNLFVHLSNPNDLYWNYFDKSGEIQIGWAYDGEIDIQKVMAEENLTENEFYAKYGSKVITQNKYCAEDFAQTLEKYRDAAKNEAFKNDLQQIIYETRLAAKTHDVAHAEKLYHILHDMDYYLLNYRLDTEGQYVLDKSTLSRYYGVLSVYMGLQE